LVILSKIWVVPDWQNRRTFADEIQNVMNMKNLALILMSLLMVCCTKDDEVKAQTMTQKMYITIDGQAQAVTLVDNQATKTLVEKLQQAPVTVTLSSSGGFEIWGALGFSLPTSNEQINAQPGDVILYNGSNICIFYGTNSWSYTRLGKIDGLSESELRTYLKAGESNIRVTLSLNNATGISNVRSNAESGAYYSLNGQRVENPSKGIFIRNGKKVIL
jgi:hypothetical protein